MYGGGHTGLGFESINQPTYPSNMQPYPGGGGQAPYPSQPGYPPQQPYPPQSAPGYPAQPGYPQPGAGGGYPPAQQPGGYPPQQGGSYPPQQGGGYPLVQQPSYPPQQQQGYPPQQPGGYPPQQQPGGYPPQQQQGYPQSQGYPPQQAPGGYPSAAAPQHGGYPAQQQQYPSLQQQQPGGYGQGQPASGYPAPAAGYATYQPQQQPGMGAQSYSQGGYGAAAMQAVTNTPVMSYAQQFQGTIRSDPNFNPNVDGEALKKAMKGFGCNDKGVMDVLCRRTNAQRQQIAMVYKQMYGKDLMRTLLDELRGKVEDVVLSLMQRPAEYDASHLRKAMEGLGTNEATLIEIMCTRNNAEIYAIKQAYRFMYQRDLERDMAGETSGYFKRLLVSMSAGARDESGRTDPARAKQHATDLLKAGVKRMGTDESTFNAILAANNFQQLQLVFQEYQQQSGHDIEKAIQGEFSGDIRDGLLALVKIVKNRPAYFSGKLYESMKGMGTKDVALIRLVVSRCEIDMVQIKQEFQRMYGKSLEAMISGDTSGNYKTALLTLIQG